MQICGRLPGDAEEYVKQLLSWQVLVDLRRLHISPTNLSFKTTPTMKLPLIPALSLCVIISSVTAQETTLTKCAKSCKQCDQGPSCKYKNDCTYASCTLPNNKFCKTTFDDEGNFLSGECVEKRVPSPTESSHTCSTNSFEGPCFCSHNSSCNHPDAYFRTNYDPKPERQLLTCCANVECTGSTFCNPPEKFCHFKFKPEGDEYESVTCEDNGVVPPGQAAGCNADAVCSCDASVKDQCNKDFRRRDQLKSVVVPMGAPPIAPTPPRHSSSKPTGVTGSGSSRLQIVQMNILTIVAVLLPLASFLGMTLFSSLFQT